MKKTFLLGDSERRLMQVTVVLVQKNIFNFIQINQQILNV